MIFRTIGDTPIFSELVEEVNVLGHVYESCEHGLSLELCEGPMHYPEDNPYDEPPF